MGGLSKYDKNTPTNQHFEMREIDPYKGLGYLKPGWASSVVTKSDDATPIIDDLIVDSQTYNGFPDPLNPSAEYNTYLASIYATYTPSAPPPAVEDVRNRMLRF